MTATISPTQDPSPADAPPGAGRLLRRATTRRQRTRLWGLLSMVSWLYLTVLACLVLWVVGVAAILQWTPHVTTSDSMEPALRAGDIVLTSSTPDDETLAVGSIIVYRSVGGEVVHRITEVDDDGSYRARGDANTAADPDPVTRAQVVGAGRLLVPFVGLPVHWLRGGQTTTLAAWLALTVLAIVLAPASRGRRAP